MRAREKSPQRKGRRTPGTRERRLLTAVAEAAAAFLKDGKSDFAATIQRGLALLGAGAGADRVSLVEHAADPAADGSSPGWLEVRFRWDAPGVAGRFPLAPAARFPYLPGGHARLLAGEPDSRQTADLPAPWRAQVARTAGARSFALVPVFVDGEYWGTLCFDSCRRARRWRPEEIVALKVAAACVGGSLERRGAVEAARGHAAQLTRANVRLQAEVGARRRAEELARGQTVALTRTLALLAADPALDSFLGQVLTAVTEGLGAPAATLYFHDPSADTLTLHMTCHEGRVFQGTDQLGHPNALVPFPANLNGFWRVLTTTRRPVEIADVEDDPLLAHHDWLSRAGVRSLLIAPLVSGERTLGCLGVRFYAGPRRARPEEIELALALAQLATLAVELTRLGGQTRAHAVAEERNRLAREIHDTLAQGLVGIFVQLQGARQSVAAGSEADALLHLDRALHLSESSLAEARRSVSALRPGILDRTRDLGTALAVLIDQTRAAATPGLPRVELRRRGPGRPLPAETEAELVRIAQEALANALRHAGARQVRLILAFSARRVRLEIADNGGGFDPRSNGADPGGRPRFGLVGMRERAERLGGRFVLTSRPRRGTHVVVTVPI